MISGFELARPWALALVPVALVLFWWLRRSAAVVQISSTFVWLRVESAVRRPHQSLWLLLVFLLVIGGLTRPRFTPSSPEPVAPAVWVRGSLGSEPPLVEVLLPVGHSGARLSCGSRIIDIPAAQENWQEQLPGSRPGDRVMLSMENHRRTATVPLARPLPRIHDGTAHPPVAQALAALEATGMIQRVPNPAGADLDLVPLSSWGPRSKPTIAIGIGSASSHSGNSPSDAIVLPTTQSPEHPALAGLDAGRWFIERRLLPPSAGHSEVVLDSSEGPLIERRGSSTLLAFDPAETDLVSSPIWPILLGRLVRASLGAPEGAEPIGPRSWPRTVLLVLAILITPLALRGLAPRALGVVLGLLLGIAVAPTLPWGAAPRVTLDETRSLESRVRELPDGGALEVPDNGTLPLETRAWSRTMLGRNIRLDVIARGGLTLSPPTPDVGQELEVRWSDPGADLGVADPGSIELRAIDPRGDVRSPARIAPGQWRQPIDLQGLWEFQVTADSRSLIERRVFVGGPIATLVLEGTGESVSASWLSKTLFGVTTFRGENALAPRLPTPPSSSLVVVQGLDPALLSDSDRRSLSDWIVEGGTLFVPGAPFFPESSAKSWLDLELPAPLPAEPRNPELGLGVLLIDCSGSMTDGAWAPVLAGVEALLAATPEGGRWGVAGFRNQVQWIAEPGTPVDAGWLARLSGTAATGGTRLDRALEAALDRLADARGGKNLVLLTDGRDSPNADWRIWGERLAAADISLTVIGCGPRADDAVLVPLTESSGGTLRRAASAEAATRLLAESIAPPRGPWRRALGMVPASERWARVFDAGPGPRRVLELTPTPDARPVATDTTGEGLLWERRRGAGRSLVWASGLDVESWPTPPADSVLATTLSSILRATIRGERGRPRAIERRRDEAGQPWLVVERRRDDPLRLRAHALDSEGRGGVGHGDGRDEEVQLVAYGPDLYRTPPLAEAIRLLRLPDEPALVIPGRWSSPAHAQDWARSTVRGEAPTGRFHLDLVLAALFALAVVGVSSRGTTPRHLAPAPREFGPAPAPLDGTATPS